MTPASDMTLTNFEDVGDFHAKFDIPRVTHEQGTSPRHVTQQLARFRINFMREELDEFISSYEHNDHAGMFDALLDLVYVALGTAHIYGFPWQEGWEAVQAANMIKIRAAPDGSDSVRQSAWDVVKPPGWVAPDIRRILQDKGWPADGDQPNQVLS